MAAEQVSYIPESYDLEIFLEKTFVNGSLTATFCNDVYVP